MMKRFIVLVAAIAAVSTVASGAVLQFHNLGMGSVDGSIASGGNYVAGSILNSGVTGVAYRTAAYWTTNPDTGAAPTVVINATNLGKGAGYYGGIDQKGASSLFTTGNAGGTVYTASAFTGRFGNPDWQSLRDHNGASSSVTTTSNNSVSVNATGTDAWAVGTWTSGVTSKGNDGQIWLWSTGVTAIFHPTGTGKMTGASIAGNGNALFTDKGGVGISGATARNRAVYWTAAIGNGVATVIPAFASNGTTTESQGFGVSDNGNYFSGLAYEPGGANYFGFRWAIGDANKTKLTMIPGAVSGTVAVAYDITDDGAAVGMSYIDDSNMVGGFATNHDTATIWFPGDTAGTRVIDLLIQSGVYHGANIRFLGRTYGIAKLADRKSVV